MQPITITAGDITLQAELNDSDTAHEIAEALPIEFSGSLWGDEIYGAVPVTAGPAPDARADVEVGELAYWPPGNAFCIFYGPTPASSGEQPRAAGPVNIIGRITDDATVLRRLTSSPTVRLEKA